MKFTIRATQMPEAIVTAAKARKTIMFVGAPGISKTDQGAVAARRLEQETGHHHEVYVLHLASMDTPDVRGFVVPQGTDCVFTTPPFWHVIQKRSHGILLLDEFPQAPHDMQKAVAPLLLDRMVGEHKLPDGWSVVLLGNRLEDNAGANTLLSHVINRINIIEVTPPSPDEWVAWGVGQNMPHELLAFAKLRPDVVFGNCVPAEADTPYCTPRSLAHVGAVANAYPGGVRAMVESPLGMAMIAGAVGTGAAGELAGLVRVAMNLPTFDEIVAAPETTPIPDTTKPDQLYAVSMMVATRADIAQVDPAMTYVNRLPFNFQLAAVMALACRNIEFVSQSAKMRAWVQTHSTEFRPYAQYINSALSASKK